VAGGDMNFKWQQVLAIMNEKLFFGVRKLRDEHDH